MPAEDVGGGGRGRGGGERGGRGEGAAVQCVGMAAGWQVPLWAERAVYFLWALVLHLRLERMQHLTTPSNLPRQRQGQCEARGERGRGGGFLVGGAAAWRLCGGVRQQTRDAGVGGCCLVSRHRRF